MAGEETVIQVALRGGNARQKRMAREIKLLTEQILETPDEDTDMQFALLERKLKLMRRLTYEVNPEFLTG